MATVYQKMEHLKSRYARDLVLQQRHSQEQQQQQVETPRASPSPPPPPPPPPPVHSGHSSDRRCLLQAPPIRNPLLDSMGVDRTFRRMQKQQTPAPLSPHHSRCKPKQQINQQPLQSHQPANRAEPSSTPELEHRPSEPMLLYKFLDSLPLKPRKITRAPSPRPSQNLLGNSCSLSRASLLAFPPTNAAVDIPAATEDDIKDLFEGTGGSTLSSFSLDSITSIAEQTPNCSPGPAPPPPPPTAPQPPTTPQPPPQPPPQRKNRRDHQQQLLPLRRSCQTSRCRSSSLDVRSMPVSSTARGRQPHAAAMLENLTAPPVPKPRGRRLAENNPRPLRRRSQSSDRDGHGKPAAGLDRSPCCQIFRVTDEAGITSSLESREDRRLTKILRQFNCEAKLLGKKELAPMRFVAIVCLTSPDPRRLVWCVDRIHATFPHWELKGQIRLGLLDLAAGCGPRRTQRGGRGRAHIPRLIPMEIP